MTVELPVLPAHWEKSRVDRVASVNARIGWKALTAAEYQTQGYTFLSTPNIKGRDIDFENVNYITEFRYQESPELKLQEGDVLLVKDGNTLGIVNLVRHLPRPATVNGSIAVIRPTGIDGAFLRYVLESRVTQAAINMLKGGMGVPHLFQWDINRLPIPVPPLEEQYRIADFLDAETARIDRLTSARRWQMSLLDERLDSVRDQLFGSPSSDSLPTPLMYLTDPYRPIVYGIVQAGPEMPDGVPYIKTGDLKKLHPDALSRTSPEIHAQYRRAAVHPGDIVMAMRASIGAVAVVPPDLPEANLTQGTARIAPARGVTGQWLLEALQTRRVREQCDLRAVGSTFRTLNIWDLRRIVINAVIPEKQRVITERFSVYATRHALIREATQRQIELLSERRQALITAAVTGQFDVSTASGRNVTDGVSA